jgi:uncharacterized protein YbjQ (UPF0145 family)
MEEYLYIFLDYINIILILFPISLGYFFGRYAEKKHYISIAERETKFRNIPDSTWKYPVPMKGTIVDAQLVTGSVVISIDYFKRLLAGLRNVFGGRVTSYESLVDRARREAMLRMKEQCPNASQIINVRIETSSISKNAKKGSVGSVEALAFGTALTYK